MAAPDTVSQPQAPVPPHPPAGVTAHRELVYVTDGHERQTLDLYLPDTGENLPLLIWIHGGAFRMGSKEGSENNPLPFAYTRQGWALASINYRLSQHAIFPAQIEDCKAAVRWLRANATRFRLDPSRFVAWGPSAGGHLAALLGTAGHVRAYDVGTHLDCSSRVQGVVDFYGPTDFLQMDAQRLPDGMIHDTPVSPESELVGGPIQEHREATTRCNPITYIRGDAPPFLIVHGDCDPLVPHGQSVLLAEALQQAGVEVTFYTVPGGGHGGFTDPRVGALTEQFLSRFV